MRIPEEQLGLQECRDFTFLLLSLPCSFFLLHIQFLVELRSLGGNLTRRAFTRRLSVYFTFSGTENQAQFRKNLIDTAYSQSQS